MTHHQGEWGDHLVELEQRIEEGTAGSLKHYAAVRVSPPGTVVTLDTVLLHRLQKTSITAGISHDLSVNTWEHNLRCVILPTSEDLHHRWYLT